ncbi:hypothetical protein QJQ45_003257 [Haematococcus lacustris]|nr:hypothetical protein QJQ45_003257 [Haematococcus lacustris]
MRSWTAASPPGLKAGSPSQVRCRTACCGQPGASGLRRQCGGSCGALGWPRPPLGSWASGWTGIATQPSTSSGQGRASGAHWSCAGGNTEEDFLPRARNTLHWASRCCESEPPRPKPSSQ